MTARGKPTATEGYLSVHVIPNQRVSRMDGVEGSTLRVRIAAKAVDSRANDELVRFIAKTLGVRRSQVEIVAGASGRRKILHVQGADPTSLIPR